jgi:ABC-type transport system involved in cytochrome c biogenesis ATPase subunit
VKEKYEEYCSSGAFTKILKRIESYFDNFNFSFKLQLATADRHTGSTKELPFAFKIVDLDGNERDLQEGLSEGEVQVLSLCFFFAFLDIQKNKNQKILVFDDPITSLDDSNLSSLVDLIAKEKDKFSQTFIFTHHRTFLKFLRKKFAKECNEYNIIRNKNHLGGSFICKSMEERFIEKLKDLETHLTQVAQNQNGFDVELKIVEYGQYLRYETEHFIKCRLLHWDESNEFAKVVDGIKDNKKVADDDLDKIKQIYSFCNWTTSHVDVGDDHGMGQLKEKIADFVAISDRY